MDENRFVAWTRSWRGMPSRRDVVRGFAAVGVGLGAARLPGSAEAQKKRRKKKPKPSKPNAFGCLNAGDRCRNAGQCCSSLCLGNKGKKRCRAHDAGNCRAGHTPNVCAAGGAEQDVACTASSGFSGVCFTTTGQAGYCGAPASATCRGCARDEECRDLFGADAACVQCHDKCGSPACVVVPGF